MPWISLSSGILIRCLEIIVTWTLFLSGHLDTKVQDENKPLLSHKNRQDHIYHYLCLKIFIVIKTLEILLFINLCRTKPAVPRLKIKTYRILMLHNSLLDCVLLTLMYVSLTSDEMDVPLLNSFFWISYYHYIRAEILLLITFLWNQSIEFLCRYGLWRTLSYICSVIINSFVVVYIAYKTLLYVYMFCTLIYNVLDQNHFITIIDDMPTYIWQNNTIDVPLNEPLLETNHEEQIYLNTIDINGRIGIAYNSFKGNVIINNSNTYLPFIREKFSRREGDDVVFTCKYSFLGARYEQPSRFADVNIFWTKDGVRIKKSNLKRLSKTINISSSTISVYSELNIYVIQENDFGKYECVESIREDTVSMVHISNIVIGYFLLEKIKLRQYRVSVPVGNLLYFKWSEFHFDDRLGNENNIHFYTINDEEISSLVTKEKYSGCPMHVLLYKSIFEIIKKFKLAKVNLKTHTPNLMVNVATNKYKVILTLCAFPGVYGVHRVTVYREIRNTETNENELHVVHHSDEVLVLPDTPYLPEQNSSSYSLLNGDLESYAYLNSSYVLKSNIFIWWSRVIVELLMLLLCVIVFIYVSATAYTYYTAIVVIPVQNFILGRYLRPNLVPLCPSKYHLCVLSSEDDTNTVVNDIVEPLQHDLDINVCCYNTDTCHLGGGSIFKCYSEVFKKSKNILLYMTRAFTRDPECMRLQFETTMSRIVNGDLRPNNVALVLGENCELPDEFKNMLQNVEIHDWTQVTSNQERLSRLRRWVLATEMEVEKVTTSVYTALI